MTLIAAASGSHSLARRWLARHPHGLAAWLQCCNALRRFILLWPAAVLAAAALIWSCSRPAVIALLQRCAAHPLMLLVIAAVCTAIAAARRRPLAQRALERSWLAALPARPSLMLRVARFPLVALALITAALIVAVLAGLRPAAGVAVFAPILAGAAAGFIAGWLLPHGGGETVPASWYGALPGWRAASAISPTLRPLGRWPLSRARVWGRPKITARWALLALLGIPLGTPAAKALAALAAVLVGWHLLSLLAAVVRVSFTAAWWLKPTAIGFVRFSASLVYLAWSRQLILCGLGLAAAAALGSPRMLHAGAALAAGWLAICCLSGAGACGWALLPRSIARSHLHRWMR